MNAIPAYVAKMVANAPAERPSSPSTTPEEKVESRTSIKNGPISQPISIFPTKGTKTKLKPNFETNHQAPTKPILKIKSTLHLNESPPPKYLPFPRTTR